jgi:hypothetical protein
MGTPPASDPRPWRALHLSEHAKLARAAGVPKVLICRNGDLIKLGPGDPAIIDEIPSRNALLQLPHDYFCVARADSPVAGESHLEPQPDRVPVDGRDSRLRDLEDRYVERDAPVDQLLDGQAIVCVAYLMKIPANAARNAPSLPLRPGPWWLENLQHLDKPQ